MILDGFRADFQNQGDGFSSLAFGDQLKDLTLPPLGDFVDGIGVLGTRNVIFVSTWRRQRGDGRPLVPSWQPWGDPDAGRKEADTAIGLVTNPRQRAALRTWYESETR